MPPKRKGKATKRKRHQQNPETDNPVDTTTDKEEEGKPRARKRAAGKNVAVKKNNPAVPEEEDVSNSNDSHSSTSDNNSDPSGRPSANDSPGSGSEESDDKDDLERDPEQVRKEIKQLGDKISQYKTSTRNAMISRCLQMMHLGQSVRSMMEEIKEEWGKEKPSKEKDAEEEWTVGLLVRKLATKRCSIASRFMPRRRNKKEVGEEEEDSDNVDDDDGEGSSFGSSAVHNASSLEPPWSSESEDDDSEAQESKAALAQQIFDLGKRISASKKKSTRNEMIQRCLQMMHYGHEIQDMIEEIDEWGDEEEESSNDDEGEWTVDFLVQKLLSKNSIYY